MVNNSIFVSVGELIRVGEDIQVTIDCGQLIDDAINSGVQNPTVNWYDNHGTPIDGRYTFSNAVISADGRQCTIPHTSLPHRIGMDGNYTCQVCSDANTCINASSYYFVCLW